MCTHKFIVLKSDLMIVYLYNLMGGQATVAEVVVAPDAD